MWLHLEAIIHQVCYPLSVFHGKYANLPFAVIHLQGNSMYFIITIALQGMENLTQLDNLYNKPRSAVQI